MNRFAHHASSHADAARFAPVQNGYFAVPLLLCGAAVLLALAYSALEVPSSGARVQAPAALEAASTHHGA